MRGWAIAEWFPEHITACFSSDAQDQWYSHNYN